MRWPASLALVHHRWSPAMKTALRRLISSVTTAPTAFDLIERNGDDDLRRVPPEVRKTTLASIVANSVKALCQSARIPPTVPGAPPIGLR
jgi:ATP-dependent DNA ligase